MQTMSSSDESVEPIPELNHNPEDDATKEEMSTENIESDDLTADKIIPDDSPDFLRIKYDEVRKVCDEQVSKLKDRNFRQQAAHRFRSSLLTILRSVFRNVQEGEWGQRGEEWFAGQAALVAFIVFGVHPVLHTLLLLAGGVSLLIGGYFVASSLGTLGENTTPFVAPVKNSKLRDYGVYRLVRHPMYGGLILLCAGLAVVTQSLDKAVLTMALTWLLVGCLIFALVTSSAELFEYVYRTRSRIWRSSCLSNDMER